MPPPKTRTRALPRRTITQDAAPLTKRSCQGSNRASGHRPSYVIFFGDVIMYALSGPHRHEPPRQDRALDPERRMAAATSSVMNVFQAEVALVAPPVYPPKTPA
jgi:hypothetical protein